MSDNNSEPASQQPPAWLAATSDDFAATDINAPIKDARTIDCLEASTVFAKAAEAAQEGQNHAQHRAYAMLGAITSFHFKPNEQHEPFGPMMRMQGKRTAQPSDFTKAMAGMLAGQLNGISHHGVRARLADLVWIVDRKQHKAAAAAIASYSSVVQAIIDDPAVMRYSGADQFNHEVPGFLRRAFQIGKAIGWEREEVAPARAQLQSLRVSAAADATVYGYARLASLDLDYRVTDSATIAAEADARAKTATGEERHILLHIAARAYRAAKNQPECDRCLLEAAEALVAVADTNRHSAMAETHWLEKAIAELRRLPSAKEMMRALKHRLVDTQSRVLDEMQSFSHSTDISDVCHRAMNTPHLWASKIP